MGHGGRVSGPVAITGAEGHVGRNLQRRLADLDNPFWALDRNDDWEPAIRDAKTVIHLAGTLQPQPPNNYQTANLGTVRRVVSVMPKGQRLVFLSYVGADAQSNNAYLRAKGEAEQLIRESHIPAVIFRSTLIYGTGDDIGPSFAAYRSGRGRAITVIGDGTQRVSPIHVDDVTEMLMAAGLDRSTTPGTFDIGGPETFTLDQFVGLLNSDDVKLRHLPARLAPLLARVLPKLTPALVEVLLVDSVTGTDPEVTAASFGVVLHHPTTVSS